MIQSNLSSRAGLIAALIMCISGTAFAQSSNERMISLKPGYWSGKQSVLVAGRALPIADLQHSDCLLKNQSEQSVEYYFRKLIASTNQGEDGQHCDFSKPLVSTGTVSTDYSCTSINGSTSNGTLKYEHSQERVDYTIDGYAQILGASAPVNVKGYTGWVRNCSAAEIEAATLQAQENKLSQPAIAANSLESVKVAEQTEPVNPQVTSPVTSSHPFVRLKPNELQSFLKTVPASTRVVVNYSLYDKKCSYCIINNQKFEEAYESLKDDFVFVEIAPNNWAKARKYKQLNRFTGLPVLELLYNKVIVSRLPGVLTEMSQAITAANIKATKILRKDFSHYNLASLNSNDIANQIAASKNGKPFVLHVTTTDPTSDFSLKDNKLFRHTAEKWDTVVQFAEISYEKINDITKDKILNSTLKKHSVVIRGLPTTVIFQNGKATAGYNGTSPDLELGIITLLSDK